jgi:hypothetical protein
VRHADRSRFPDGAQFEAFKTEGRLDSPEAAAAKLLRFLARPDFGTEVVADVRSA